MSKTFCPIPWIFQSIRNNGDLRVCCQANVAKNRGILRYSDGSPMNISNTKLHDAINADLLKEIRLKMLNNQWHEECGRCKTEEEFGLDSRRIYENEMWHGVYDEAMNITNYDGSIPTNNQIRYYDFRFGNFCNLACRMCGPMDSHFWYEQWIDYNQTHSFTDTHGLVNLKRDDKGKIVSTDYDWHKDDSFWHDLEKNIDNIQYVYMAGGEPLIIEKHYEFLEKCIELDVAGKIILEYNTNITSIPKRAINIWRKFKKVKVGCSVDGIKEVIEYQRWPVKWKTIEKNLIKLNKIARENRNIVVWISSTITIYNVWQLPKFLWWKIFESNLDFINVSKKSPIIKYHVAHRPKRTNIRLLNNDLKYHLKSIYESYIEKILQTDKEDYVKQNFINILNSITDYMFSEDCSIDTPEFIRFTEFLDEKRNQNILSVIPEYSIYFNENK